MPWGRSFDEYREMFSLTDVDLDKSILGCGDGPASFNAELTQHGGRVVSVDPIYRFSVAELRDRFAEAYDQIMPQAEQDKGMYVWDRIPSVEALGDRRKSAMKVFITDYESGKADGRYIEGSLPRLNFTNKQFDLALCSHYLFLYSEQVSLEQHIEYAEELCRVADEVRIYPLLSLNGRLSPHLKEVMAKLQESGLVCSLEHVEYQFLRGATHQLLVHSVQ